MRVSYYGYWVRDTRRGINSLYDLGPFFRTFCSSAPARLKDRVMLYDQHLFLFDLIGDLYFFARTRNEGVVKKVDAGIKDIPAVFDLFNEGEYLGFASYILVQGYSLVLACPILAPTIAAFTVFIDQVFALIGLGHYRFCTETFFHQTSKDELLGLASRGETAMEANEKQNLRRSLPDTGLEEVVIKAKEEEADGRAVDVYLADLTPVLDAVEGRDEAALRRELTNRISSELLLQNMVRDFTARTDFVRTVPDDLLRLSDPASWPFK